MSDRVEWVYLIVENWKNYNYVKLQLGIGIVVPICFKSV